MSHKDKFRTEKQHGDSLGGDHKHKKVEENPAPKENDRESEMTPKENEVYVDLEPDELHLGDEDVDEVKEK